MIGESQNVILSFQVILSRSLRFTTSTIRLL